jgi:exopolysaccharide production protein ExoQ
MFKASTHSLGLGQAGSSASIFDKKIIVPILACAYTSIVFPLILISCSQTDLRCLMETRPENKLFWPAMAAVSILLAVVNLSRLGKFTLPPHIMCLLAYLAFAGASVLWAFKPELSFIRFAQQVMIITSIVLPAMLASRTTDMMRGVFLCFAFASILNIVFVLSNPPSLVKALNGYPGYFTGKNLLGEFAAAAFLLALHEMLYSGLRRALGIVVGIIATILLFFANSKTALGLALLAPIFAGLTLIAGRAMRASPAVVLLSLLSCYAVLSTLSGFTANRLSYMLYGDSSFTGRTVIWDFANTEISRRPFLGWGYQSFWLAGPDAPSKVDAPGWVKNMPNAHNGYVDTKLEMGYVGLAFLVIFITATLHAIKRVAARDPARAWLLLSLAIFIIFYNFLESLWMRGFDLLWVVFVIVAAEVGRHWRPLRPVGRSHKRQRVSHKSRRLEARAALAQPAKRSNGYHRASASAQLGADNQSVL